MSARRQGRRGARRRVVQLGVRATAIGGPVVAVGAARAALLAAGVGLCSVAVLLIRHETRSAGAPPRAGVAVRPEVWAHPGDRHGVAPERLGPAGHRAYARALHAVTEAYLAYCEREAQR